MIGSLEEAFDQLEAFSSVQLAQRGGFTIDAVNLLQESVGIQDAERRLIVERVDEVAPDAQTGALLLGMILGLLAASREASPTSG
jgi:hypothetical protein